MERGASEWGLSFTGLRGDDLTITASVERAKHPFEGLSEGEFAKFMSRAGLGSPEKMQELLNGLGPNFERGLDTVRRWYKKPEKMPSDVADAIASELRRRDDADEIDCAAPNSATMALFLARTKARHKRERDPAALDASRLASHRRAALHELIDCLDDEKIEYLAMQAVDMLSSERPPMPYEFYESLKPETACLVPGKRDGTLIAKKRIADYRRAVSVLLLTSGHRGSKATPSRNYEKYADCEYTDLTVMDTEDFYSALQALDGSEKDGLGKQD